MPLHKKRKLIQLLEPYKTRICTLKRIQIMALKKETGSDDQNWMTEYIKTKGQNILNTRPKP